MSVNEFYTPTGSPSDGAAGASAAMRGEFQMLKSAFDLLPTMGGNGNLPVFVNSGGTAMLAISAANARSNLGIGSAGTMNSNNVAITGGNISGLTSLSTNNVTLTGGAISGITATSMLEVGTNNAQITGGSISGLLTLGTNNGRISGGVMNGITMTSMLEVGTNNAQITGGSISGVTFSTNNLQATGGSVTGVNPLSTSNAQITGGNISNNTVVAHTFFSNSLTADVLLNNTSVFFDGPSLNLGSGTWDVSTVVTVVDTAGAAQINAKLWDGNNVIASVSGTIESAAHRVAIPIQGIVTSPTGNVKISVKDGISTNGKILWNESGSAKDSTITAIRIG